MNADVLECLKSLHANAIDARNGYDEAMHDADGNGFSSLFDEMIVIHAENADELAVELERAGEAPGDDGSFMTTIHSTIMSIRALFGGLDESVVPGLIDGEKRNVASYRQALEISDMPPDIRALLETQCRRLEAAIVTMQTIKD
jgi:uncharacterized protein (TIGR02284 family)